MGGLYPDYDACDGDCDDDNDDDCDDEEGDGGNSRC